MVKEKSFMKKINLIQFAVASLVCISGQAPSNANQALAMTKSPQSTASNTSKAGSQKRVQVRAKSAARKVIEGINSSLSSVDGKPSSAAKRSVDAESNRGTL
jgi:hypothetical protein